MYNVFDCWCITLPIVYHSISIHIYLYPSISMYIYGYVYLAYMPIHIYICVYIHLYPSIAIYIHLYPSISIYIYLYLSISRYIIVSIYHYIYIICISISIYIPLSLSIYLSSGGDVLDWLGHMYANLRWETWGKYPASHSHDPALWNLAVSRPKYLWCWAFGGHELRPWEPTNAEQICDTW